MPKEGPPNPAENMPESPIEPDDTCAPAGKKHSEPQAAPQQSEAQVSAARIPALSANDMQGHLTQSPSQHMLSNSLGSLSSPEACRALLLEVF